jgi:hypothetical protein
MRCSRLAIAFWGVVSFLASTTSVCAKTQLGFGLSPCSQYNQLRQQAPAIGHEFDAWILGYLSGVNFIVYLSRGVDLLAAENSEKIIGYIRSSTKVKRYGPNPFRERRVTGKPASAAHIKR